MVPSNPYSAPCRNTIRLEVSLWARTLMLAATLDTSTLSLNGASLRGLLSLTSLNSRSGGPSDDRTAGAPDWTVRERPWRVDGCWRGTALLRCRRLRCLARRLGATDTQHTLRRRR